MKNRVYCRLFLSVLLGAISVAVFSQNETTEKEKKEKPHISFKDTLDGALDLSDFVLDKNGFVPVVSIITEPALGGFGLAVAPVFIQQNAPVKRDDKIYPSPPNIATGFAGYTLNDSWAGGAATTGVWQKWGLKYTAALAYADVNMEYYFNLDKINKDVEIDFNIRAIPFFVQLEKQMKDPRFTIGLHYLFMHNTVQLKNDLQVSNEIAQKFIDKFDDYLTDKISGNVARLGTKIAFDTRDNIFTPDRGLRTYLTADWSNPLVGSDYKYGQFEGAFYYFFPILNNLITGTRLDMQQVTGNQPFYLRPFVDMRGVPTARYGGKSTALLELEERWDIVPRWSVVGFAGAGKAFDKYSEFSDAEWAWGYGAGFRYLIARKLKLRMGVDLAMGPEGFAYYIVFGSSWLRQ